VEIQRISVARRVATRWTLQWRAVEDGLHFHLASPRLVGLHAAGEELDLDTDLAYSVTALESVIPDWRVDGSGHFAELAPGAVESALDSTRAIYLARTDSTDGYRTMTLSTLASGGFRLAAARRSEELWRALVGEWLGLPRIAHWTESDQPLAFYREVPRRAERVREVVALTRQRGVDFVDLRESYVAPVDSTRERSVLLQCRAEATTLRPLRASQRISLGEAYEEQLILLRWPDLHGY
jgi:hypothetical protein